MKKILIILIISIISISFSFIGCNSEGKYTAEEWGKKQEGTGENTQTTVNNIETTTKINIENKSKINDYNNRLDEWGKFITEYLNATQEIEQELTDLDNNRVAASKAKDYEKAIAYLREEIDKSEEVINNLSNIYVPEIAKEYYSYKLDFYTKDKQFFLNLLTPNDVSETNSLRDEAITASINANNELKRIMKGFNKEAQELGLPIQFPNQ